MSSESKFAVSASKDCTIKVWNLVNNDCVHTVREHTVPVNFCVLTSDDRFLLNALNDMSIRIWDFANREPVSALIGHDSHVFLYGCIG